MTARKADRPGRPGFDVVMSVIDGLAAGKDLTAEDIELLVAAGAHMGRVRFIATALARTAPPAARRNEAAVDLWARVRARRQGSNQRATLALHFAAAQGDLKTVKKAIARMKTRTGGSAAAGRPSASRYRSDIGARDGTK